MNIICASFLTWAPSSPLHWSTQISLHFRKLNLSLQINTLMLELPQIVIYLIRMDEFLSERIWSDYFMTVINHWVLEFMQVGTRFIFKTKQLGICKCSYLINTLAFQPYINFLFKENLRKFIYSKMLEDFQKIKM